MAANLHPAALRPSPVLLLLTLLAAPLPTGARDDRVPLFPEELSACNRDQLDALVERISVTTPAGALSPVVQSVLLTYSNRFGFFEGVVAGMPFHRSLLAPGAPGFQGPGPEHQLAFHLNPDVRELLLNPARTPLAQVSLTRETSTSNLVAADDPFAVRLRLRPGLPPGGAPGAGDLVIDNLAAPGPDGQGVLPADTKPGRGLSTSGITGLCHTKLTALDRRIFAILQRTLRVYVPHEASGLAYDTRIAIYRGVMPTEYDAQVHLVNPVTGALELPPPFFATPRLSIFVVVDDDGRLTEGLLAFTELPAVAASKGFAAIVRPVFGGQEPGAEYDAVAQIPWDPFAQPFSFDWRDVLDGTAWNDAGPAPN